MKDALINIKWYSVDLEAASHDNEHVKSSTGTWSTFRADTFAIWWCLLIKSATQSTSGDSCCWQTRCDGIIEHYLTGTSEKWQTTGNQPHVWQSHTVCDKTQPDFWTEIIQSKKRSEIDELPSAPLILKTD